MTEAQVLSHLEQLALRLGVQLRYENLGYFGLRTEGGYCRLGDKVMILVNRKDSNKKKIMIISKSLNKLDLEGIFVPPGIRKVLESHRNLPDREDGQVQAV